MAVISSERSDEKSYQVPCGNMACHVRIPLRDGLPSSFKPTPTALKGRRNPPQGEALGILAGGMSTRLAEETDNRPKPMVEIGGRPILWRIMKVYSA